MNVIEILALILIVISAVKILTILVAPKSWLNFAKKFYVKPRVTSAIALVLAAVLLYFLIGAGITIVEILAIALFVAMLLLIGLSLYMKEMMKKIDSKKILKEQWLYTLIWVALLAWGIYELFFM